MVSILFILLLTSIHVNTINYDGEKPRKKNQSSFGFGRVNRDYVPDHNDYHDSNKRTASLKRIASEMTIEINHNQVKDIMESLHTIFLRERKEEDSLTSGKGGKQVYKSNWKFFDECNFLALYLKPILTESSIQIEPIQTVSDVEEVFNEDDDEHMATPEEVHNNSQGTRSRTDSSLHKSRKKKRPATDNLIFQSSSVMQSV